MYEDLAKKLKKNIEVMENTFSSNNLQIMNLNVRPCGNDDADCDILVELSTIDGGNINNSVNIKINLYDESNDLYAVEEFYIDECEFTGYDTIKISCYNDEETLKKVVKGRIYVTLA